MLNLLGFLAVGCCGLFAGAALYVNLVEHPARISCGVELALVSGRQAKSAPRSCRRPLP